MMAAQVEVVHPGALASIQDRGRPGWRRIGVPHSGALEPGWLHLANALAGNDPQAPAIEFFAGGLFLRALEAPVRLGLAGCFSAERSSADGWQRVDSWRSLTLLPGESLRCGTTGAARLAYVALAGLAVRHQLGSAATDARAGLGGLAGKPLAAGDRLDVAAAVGGDRMLRFFPQPDPAPLRVVFGPQADYFTPQALARFLGESYTVSQAADRMGLRLEGARLQHRPDKDVEIVSDATVPGSVQVPGNGQPIVLLADGQTVGGYPKIATVISADLPRLAVLPPGQTLRFAAVTVGEAEAAARQRARLLQIQAEAIVPYLKPGELDLQAMYSVNLLSGMVDAWSPDVIPLRD